MRSLLPAVLLIALTVYCLVSIAQARPGEVRNLPRWAWLVLVLVFPLAGGIAYVVAGRPLPGGKGPGGGPGGTWGPPRTRRQAPRGPDDDEDFLRGL